MTLAKTTSEVRALRDLRPFIGRLANGALAAALASFFVFAVWPGAGGSPTRQTLVWATAVLAALTGWGSTLARLARVDPRLRPDWGLRASWGMAVVVAIGGCLLAVGVASAPVLRVVVGAGVLLQCVEMVRGGAEDDGPRSAGSDPVFVLGAAIVYALGFLVCVGSLVDLSAWYGYDDGPAYLVFPKQILETGDFLQPFSIRRMVGFGAQSLLQAVVLPGSSMGRAHLFDHGLCTVLVLALLLGLPRGQGAPPVVLRFIYAGLIIFMPNPRMNVASVLSGTVFLFALYRSIDLPAETFRSSRGRAVVTGLLVAGASALRPSFVLPAVGTVVLSHVLSRSEAKDRSATLREGALAAFVVALALLPWCVCLFRSNGTFLYPPFNGGYRPETGFTRFVLGRARLDQLRTELLNFEPIGTIHLFFLAGAVMTDESPRRAMRASFLSLFFLGFIALLMLVPIVDFRSLARYRTPAEVAFVLVVAARAFGASSKANATRNLVGSAMVIAACCFELAWQHEDAKTSLDAYFDATYRVLSRQELPDPLASRTRDALATSVQASVPPGEPMLVMLDDAYRLDFRRNPIEILDVPAIVSPGEGLPVFRGPSAFAEYLLAHGLRYVAYVEPRRSRDLYGRPQWEKNALDDGKMPQNFTARYVLDVFDNLDRLKRTRRHLLDESDTVVLDLASFAP
jgi:hypothetical protein